MMELLKKSAFVGLGLAVLSTSAIKKMGEKMAEESKLTEEEGKKLVDDLLAESEKSKVALRKRIDTSVQDSVVELDLATAEDMDSINRRLDGIEQLLNKDSKATTKSSYSSDS